MGILVSIDHAYPAGYRSMEPEFYDNGLIHAEIIYSNPQDKRLIPVSNSEINWLVPQSVFAYPSLPDASGALRNVLGGSFAPYELGNGNGSSFALTWTILPQDFISINKLSSVDIVITNDQSKWTRCPVIQMSAHPNSLRPPILSRSYKSLLPSVDKNGNPDPGHLDAYLSNTPSTGYGWFPGYAIDIQKGIRLNMAFTENKERDSISGNDLLYNPSANDSVPHHFIAVTNLEYDMESSNSWYQKFMDSVFISPLTISNYQYGKVFQEIFTWTGILDYVDSTNQYSSSYPEMRIRLRVNKPYRMTEDGIDPKWTFYPRQGMIQNRVQANILDEVSIVPNPYLFNSPYDAGGNRNVKITKLPGKCRISIYNMQGSLVKVFNRDYPEDLIGHEASVQEWDLRNETGLDIGSGIYLIHVDAGEKGEAVKKLFYIKGDEQLPGTF
jgi:hypothetical protein